MTEEQIKEMLLDIINNNAEYEWSIQKYHDDPWHTYKLGDEILPDCEFQKVEKWYVYKSKTEANGFTKGNDGFWYCTVRYEDEHTVFSGSREACEKWVEEHTKKWIEEKINKISTDEFVKSSYRMFAKKVCKKILEEVHKKWEQEKSYNGKALFSDIGNELEKIIKDLGVEV